MVQRQPKEKEARAGEAPRLLGRYHVLDEIGRNALGQLFLARLEGPQGFQRWAAMRTVDRRHLTDPTFRQQFFDRAREGAKLLHPNVATLFDVGEDESTLWAANEYLQGERVQEIIARIEMADTPVSWEVAARIVVDAAEGLHALHALKGPDGKLLGLMHGDLGPHSIMVTYEGKAKIKGAFEPHPHPVLDVDPRKVAYTAPEQLFDEPVDARADVFALGVILWELVAGRRLFARSTEDETRAMIEAGLVPNLAEVVSSVPVSLDAIIARALSRKVDQRYASARDLGRGIEEVLVARRVVVRDDDVARYMRTLFADRVTTQETVLKEAADVTEIFRKSHAMRAALPNLAPKDDDDEGDADETRVIAQRGDDDGGDDTTTAEHRAAPRAPLSAPTAVRRSSAPPPPPHSGLLADSGSLPTLTLPIPEAPHTEPMMMVRPLPAMPPRPMSRFLPEPPPPRTPSIPLTTPSDAIRAIGPIPEGSAVFVTPKSRMSEPDASSGRGAIAAQPTLHVRAAGEELTLTAHDASVVAPPPRPRTGEETTMSGQHPIPAPAPTVPRAGPEERTLTGYDLSTPAPPLPSAFAFAATMQAPPPRRPNEDDRTLTAYDVPPPPPQSPGPFTAQSPLGMPTLPPATPGPSQPDARPQRKQVATVAVLGVGGGVVIFLALLLALRSHDPVPGPTVGSGRPVGGRPSGMSATATPTATATATATATPTPTATATPTATSTTGTIPTMDLTKPAPHHTTTVPHTTRTVAPPPPPPPVAAGGKGYLTVMCRPTACDQVLDGISDLGESPFNKKPISAGKHRLTFRVSSPKMEKTVFVDINEGETTTLRPDMSQ